MDHSTLEHFRAVYLTAEDLRVAASILFNAYHDDPFFKDALYTGDKFLYEQKLRAAIREELHELWQQEQVLIGWFEEERLIGVACVITQQVPLGDGRYWHWRLKMLLGTGWQSTQRLMKKENSIVEHLPGNRCGILQFIALAPTEQGKGNGSQLLRAVLGWCDDQPDLEGLAVFVSVPMHQHLFFSAGFEALAHLQIGNVDGELLFYRKEPHE
ncbi:GNAT family N-acetyltransferase [Shewanella cyperi]|uniref:GNAT family N-acetyltransferase n=1 Tax=Shewanella cyperi TaxID=2814292 RepID=A0A974XVJ2_9GAMM|nr:GNAT family N-acetyltransferase [Shewanella cyperi]QSX31059.1 GNAT family N-acetyltransferase [Shewanella cyperi]